MKVDIYGRWAGAFPFRLVHPALRVDTVVAVRVFEAELLEHVLRRRKFGRFDEHVDISVLALRRVVGVEPSGDGRTLEEDVRDVVCVEGLDHFGGRSVESERVGCALDLRGYGLVHCFPFSRATVSHESTDVEEPIMPEPEATVDGSTVLRVADSILKRTAGTETVLLDLDSEEFFGLDGVGARAFELFEQPRRLDEVVDVLLTEYDVDQQTLTTDVTDLVSDLVSRNLLVIDA